MTGEITKHTPSSYYRMYLQQNQEHNYTSEKKKDRSVYNFFHLTTGGLACLKEWLDYCNCNLLVWCFAKPYSNYFCWRRNKRTLQNSNFELFWFLLPNHHDKWTKLDHKYHNMSFLTIEIQRTPITRELWITVIHGSKR